MKSLLRAALTANATFSAASGLALTAAPGALGTALGLDAPLVLRAVGIGLLGFAVFIAMLLRGDRIPEAEAKLVTVGDAGWVLGTAGLLAAKPDLFSAQGTAIVIAVAAVVALFGTLQLAGIKRQCATGAATAA
jgi:hypothetical protein